jgi:hypothetical protein
MVLMPGKLPHQVENMSENMGEEPRRVFSIWCETGQRNDETATRGP